MNNNTTDNFWNDDLVKEYTHDVIIKALNERTVSPRTWDEQILKFRQSKFQQLKEEPKCFGVLKIKRINYVQWPGEEAKASYQINTTEIIPEEKYEAIKLTIERELNGVGSGLVQDLGLEFNLDAYKPFLKKEKLDAMMENVWNAAREFTGGTAQNTFYDIASQLKYKTFQDYQQSLPENKPETNTTSNASLKCQNEEKKLLFTTEDGVKIFEGDTFYYTPKETMEWVNSCCMAMPQPVDHFKYFSTKATAEKHILENKPCLTFNEAMICYKYFHYDYSDFKKHLSELVNQKIKQ